MSIPSSNNVAPSSSSSSSLPPSRPLIGIGVLILDSLNHPGCILVGERRGSHGSKTFATPGGHLEYGEEWSECARREVKEETNLDLVPSSLRHVSTVNTIFHDVSKHYVTLFMSGGISSHSCELQNLEPEKCLEWVWKSWKELQRGTQTGEIKVFPPLQQLLNDQHFKLE